MKDKTCRKEYSECSHCEIIFRMNLSVLINCQLIIWFFKMFNLLFCVCSNVFSITSFRLCLWMRWLDFLFSLWMSCGPGAYMKFWSGKYMSRKFPYHITISRKFLYHNIISRNFVLTDFHTINFTEINSLK